MISRRLKATYYVLMDAPLFVSSKLYKAFLAPKGKQSPVKVQLGPGQQNYLPGWLNVDANFISAKIDVWASLEHGLPFRDNSVDVIYSHHVIEHLVNSNLQSHFDEMFRCLKPGGVIRVGGPNTDEACRQYLAGNASWFGDFPDKHDSIGGKLQNFVFCRGEHFTMLTHSYFSELCKNSGFADVRFCRPKTETFHPEWIDESVFKTEWESTPETPHTIIVEAVKPK